MNTPITDAAMVRVLDTEGTRTAGSNVEAVFKLYVCPLVARRLELDRAALMESLEDLMKVLIVVAGDQAPVPRIALGYANEALSAARANFPEP